jgi:HEAT repeat protein
MRKIYCLLLLALVGCGKQSTAYWSEQAKAPDAVVRLHAIHALSQKTEEAADVVPVLVGLLKDPDAFVRRDAVRALGGFGDDARSAVPALLSLHNDKEMIRREAVDALLQIDPDAAAKFPKKKPKR